MKTTGNELTQEQLDRLAALAARPDTEIDLSDQPEITDWSQAVRGPLYRPRKLPVTIRIDADILAWFKTRAAQDDTGYQTAMNQALRAFIAAQRTR